MTIRDIFIAFDEDGGGDMTTRSCGTALMLWGWSSMT